MFAYFIRDMETIILHIQYPKSGNYPNLADSFNRIKLLSGIAICISWTGLRLAFMTCLSPRRTLLNCDNDSF